MALEAICGLKNMPFMVADINNYYARLELNTAKCVFDNPYTMMAPPFDNPVERLEKILFKDRLQLNVMHGTTTLGFRYNGGIILCADTRGSHGTFVASHTMRKIVEVDKCILGTIAGGAGDCTYWDRVISRECRLYRLETRGGNLPVTSASCILWNITHMCKGMGLCMGMILAGYDPDGPKLIYLDSDGQRTEGNIFAVGSGAVHALGILDIKHTWNMTDNEAYHLAKLCVYHSTFLDSYTGGSIQLYHITEAGWRLVSLEDSDNMHDEFHPTQNLMEVDDP